nr:MFS transporter [Actinomycetota bacterium]
VMALLLILGPKLLPEFRNPEAGRLDLTSAAMSLSAVLGVIYGLKQIAQDGFRWLPLMAIAAGLAFGVAFARRQTRLADPLIDIRLFRVPAFSVSVATNALAGFIAFGTFLYIAQYLQSVLGLSPWHAALWSLPSSIGVVAGSMLAPAILRGVRPALAAAGGLGLVALGLGILTQVEGADGLAVLVSGSVVFSLGLGPLFVLTADLIVGSAPPERAGAASAISETGAELGGALGIAILGSIGAAVYRTRLINAVPDEVPRAAADAARDTIGGALSAAQQLPGRVGEGLAGAARDAFTQGLHISAGIGAVIALGTAILVVILLRDVKVGSEPTGEAALETDGAAGRRSGAGKVLEPASGEC